MDYPTKIILQQARDDATKAIIKSQRQKREHPISLEKKTVGKQLQINYSQLKLF